MNVNTLKPKGSLDELVRNAKKNTIDIISIQEHRHHHPNLDLQYSKVDKYQLVTSSAPKNSRNASIGGVGILLSPRACENLIQLESISDRIMVAEFNSNPKLTLIACYSPTNTLGNETEVNEFYKTLKSTVESVPAHNFLSIAGDFNAKLGPDDAAFTYDTKTNRNGEMLLSLLDEFNLFSASNTFMKSKSKLWTFTYPNGSRAQLDYILFRKKWRNSINNAQAYSSFSSIGSDHRIVSAKATLSLRAPRKVSNDPMKLIDWAMVTSDNDLASKYSIDVYNRYTELALPDDNASAQYSKMITANNEIALSPLPKKTKSKPMQFSTHQLVALARDKLEDFSRQYDQNPTSELKGKITQSKKELEAAYTSALTEYIEGKITSLKSLHINKQHSAAWEVVNEITGRKDKPSPIIKGGSQSARKENWTDHFKNLLGEPSHVTNEIPKVTISPELNISTSPFTRPEINVVLKTLKNKKSPGLDNIPSILWKDPNLSTILLDICNDTFNTLDPPETWLTAGIVPVPKKGDLSNPKNYRGISLMPIAAKVYNKLILNRIYPSVDPILRTNQNGFRRGRSTAAQILSLRRIVEETRNANREMSLVFVDFRKAFDSINRDTLFEILPLYGIPPKLVKAIQALYQNTSATIITPDGHTDFFNILAGVLQGDTLAPFLFIIALDYALRLSLDANNSKGITLQPRTSTRHPSKHLTDLDFADDLSLLSNYLEDAQLLLHSLEHAASLVGLHLNKDKTQYITTSKSESVIKTSDGHAIKKVEDFKYLGAWIMDSGKDFNTRKAQAWSACNKVDSIWRSDLPKNIKIQFFQSLIQPILLYGSETWTLNSQQQKRLDGTFTNLLRRVQNLSWKQHATIHQIYNGLPRISDVLRQRRVKFAGHCYHASSEVVSSLVLWRPKSTTTRRGRKLSYPDMISRDTGIELQDLPVAMSHRPTWRSIVESISANAAG